MLTVMFVCLSKASTKQQRWVVIKEHARLMQKPGESRQRGVKKLFELFEGLTPSFETKLAANNT